MRTVGLSFAEILEDLVKEKLQSDHTLSESKIASGIGIGKATLSDYQNPKDLSNPKQPTMSNLIKIATYFDVSLDYLVGRSKYRNDEHRHITAKRLGLSERTVRSMYGQTSISPSLNLLTDQEETNDAFMSLLKKLNSYYFACEADCVAWWAKAQYMRQNNWMEPNNQQLSNILAVVALNDKLDPETQAKVFTLSERFKKAEETSIFTDDEEDHVFLNKLQMRDIYELQGDKCFKSLTLELERIAEKKIRGLSLFSDELDTN